MKQITASDLTAEEKLRLICGKDFWHTVDLGGKIPAIKMADGPTGLRVVCKRDEKSEKEESIPAVAYPAISMLANAWDPDVARRMGECLGDDALERGVGLLLAPGVNIKRDPLNGRNFEYFSEDPYLAGTMAEGYIEGVQSRGVGVCLKHFCANNSEYDRLHQSSDVDERTLREIYYVPFELACKAKPVSVMCSYNRINGTYGAEYKKGFDLLRGEFGFDGAIFSDWSAVRDRTKSAKAGLDIEMPFCEESYQKLCKDYREGKLSDEELDACAQRVLDLAYRLKGMSAGRRPQKTEAERLAAAKDILSESVVLLKNDGVLPLRSGQSVFVAGSFAKASPNMLRGGGSACVRWTEEKYDLAEALTARGYTVDYEKAFLINEVGSWQNARTAVLKAGRSDVNIVCVGTGDGIEYEGGDRQTLRLPAVQEQAILDTAAQNPNTVVVLFSGGAVDVSRWIDHVKAVVYAGFTGEGGDEVVADVLTGRINPSGKLSETFPWSLEDVPAANTYKHAGVTRYQDGLDVGYRYYDTYSVPVAFPFGHGLSYASFAYQDGKADREGDKVKVTFVLENTSDVAGKETAQVYVRERAPFVYRPEKELKGYKKTELAAGESKRVCVELPLRAFAHWSASTDHWEITEGDYVILVGASSQDIRLQVRISLPEVVL